MTSKQICGKHEVDSGRRGGLNMIERLWWFPKIHVYDKKLYSNPVDRLARWSGRAASTIAAHHSQYARYYTDFLLKNFVFHFSQFSLAGVEPAQPEFGICQVWISKCRRKSDLGLRMTSVLGERMQLRSADFRRIQRPNLFLNSKSALCGRVLFASTEIMHRLRSDFSLHIY